ECQLGAWIRIISVPGGAQSLELASRLALDLPISRRFLVELNRLKLASLGAWIRQSLRASVELNRLSSLHSSSSSSSSRVHAPQIRSRSELLKRLSTLIGSERVVFSPRLGVS
ncbi:hypothetical protein FCV25MIE_15648, partial [Fagus crenata]